MSEVYDINQMSAGEFIDTMVILLEGSGLDRLKFSGDKDFRSVSDLVLLKDIAGEMKAICQAVAGAECNTVIEVKLEHHAA